MADGAAGRPPSLPPLTEVEDQSVKEQTLWLKGGDPEGKVLRDRYDLWREETQLEWLIQLRMLARRAHGRDAVDLIKLGASLLAPPPRQK